MSIVQKGEVEGLSIPDYAIESLFLSLQTVIGGRHYYKFAKAVFEKLKAYHPECVYTGPYDESNKRIQVEEEVSKAEAFLMTITKRMYNVKKPFSCSAKEFERLEQILMSKERRAIKLRAAKLYGMAKKMMAASQITSQRERLDEAKIPKEKPKEAKETEAKGAKEKKEKKVRAQPDMEEEEQELPVSPLPQLVLQTADEHMQDLTNDTQGNSTLSKLIVILRRLEH